MKALELDDSLGEAHSIIGKCLNEFEWDRVGAEKELRRAIELDPNNSNIRWTFSNFLSFQTRFDEAITVGRRVVELDPLSKRSALTVALIGYRRYDEAISQLKEVLQLDPNYADTYIGLGMRITEKVHTAKQSPRFKGISNWTMIQ